MPATISCFVGVRSYRLTDHAIDTLTRLREYELLYPALARPACEAVCMVAFVTRHDRLRRDRLLAYETLRTVRKHVQQMWKLTW